MIAKNGSKKAMVNLGPHYPYTAPDDRCHRDTRTPALTLEFNVLKYIHDNNGASPQSVGEEFGLFGVLAIEVLRCEKLVRGNNAKQIYELRDDEVLSVIEAGLEDYVHSAQDDARRVRRVWERITNTYAPIKGCFGGPR